MTDDRHEVRDDVEGHREVDDERCRFSARLPPHTAVSRQSADEPKLVRERRAHRTTNDRSRSVVCTVRAFALTSMSRDHPANAPMGRVPDQALAVVENDVHERPVVEVCRDERERFLAR